MSGPTPPRAARSLPATPNLEQQKKQARELLRAALDGEASAVDRFRIHPRLAESSADELRAHAFSLHEAQLVLAREYGFASWVSSGRTSTTPSGCATHARSCASSRTTTIAHGDCSPSWRTASRVRWRR